VPTRVGPGTETLPRIAIGRLTIDLTQVSSRHRPTITASTKIGQLQVRIPAVGPGGKTSRSLPTSKPAGHANLGRERSVEPSVIAQRSADALGGASHLDLDVGAGS